MGKPFPIGFYRLMKKDRFLGLFFGSALRKIENLNGGVIRGHHRFLSLRNQNHTSKLEKLETFFCLFLMIVIQFNSVLSFDISAFAFSLTIVFPHISSEIM